MKCKNKEFSLYGAEGSLVTGKIKPKKLRVICTNDEMGKSLSIDNGSVQFSIPFEKIEECFEGDFRK